MSVAVIAPTRLAEIRSSGRTIRLIDVRTPAEFADRHVDFAKNIPLDRLDPAVVAKDGSGSTEDPIYLICQGGVRARQACEKLQVAGIVNVVNVEGGTQAWEQAGLPVIRGAKAMSLERQVRIAAGSLVLTGVILGYFVHPYLIGLSAFVGAGLVFAGITDTCGMGLLLARMPWNQRGACAS